VVERLQARASSNWINRHHGRLGYDQPSGTDNRNNRGNGGEVVGCCSEVVAVVGAAEAVEWRKWWGQCIYRKARLLFDEWPRRRTRWT
jgi:hypothetical protein